MQISREALRKHAETTVEKIARVDHTILAVYLTGSMVSEENPFLGGTADIDLVFIHIGEPKVEREILPLNEDLHLDIAHHPQSKYRQKRELRTHPWLGPVLSEASPLYDPQYFLDLILASVRGLFHRPNYVLQRSQAMLQSARELWRDLKASPQEPAPTLVDQYLTVLERAANAIALLEGDPLTERRFLLNFPQRAAEVGHAGLNAGLLGLLGAYRVEHSDLAAWVDSWTTLLDSIPERDLPPKLCAGRRNYYSKAFSVLLDSDQPQSVLWPLLRTWTLAAHLFPENDPAIQDWNSAIHRLSLSGASFEDRLLASAAFLDQIEEIVTQWGQERGA